MVAAGGAGGGAGDQATQRDGVTPLARAILDELAGDAGALAELAAVLAPYLPAQAAAPEDAWMDSAEAARYLSLSKAALHRLTAQRVIPFEQDAPNAKLWFKRAELDTWRRSGGAAAAPMR